METILKNRLVRTLLFMAIGGGAGYFVGNLVANKIMATNEFEEILPDEGNVDVEVITSEEVVVVEQPVKMQKKRSKTARVPVRDYASQSKTVADKGDLATLAAKYTGNGKSIERQTEDLFDEMAEAEPERNDGHFEPLGENAEALDTPQVISADEYNNRPETRMPFTKTLLNYYEDDEVITDEGGQVVMNPEKYLGPDALDSFGVESGDPDVVYVMNPRTGDMYQVNRHHKSFAEAMIAPKPSRRSSSSRKARKENEEP